MKYIRRLYRKLNNRGKKTFWLLFIGLFMFGVTQIRMDQVKGLLTALGLRIEVVADITALENYSGYSSSVKVSDANRGGFFEYVTSAQTPDSGTVFPANGKGTGYWKRTLSGAEGYYVTWFGAKGDGATNDTKNIQLTINSCSAAGGHVVLFPVGVYIIGDTLFTSTCNCQLKIPGIAGNDPSRNHITLRGVVRPVSDPAGFGLSGDAALPIATGMVVLKSTLATGGGSGAFVIGTALAGPGLPNKTVLDVENISIQVKNNPTGVGPLVGGIGWKNGGMLHVNYVNYYVDTSGFRSTIPSNDIVGIEFPDEGADDDYNCENTMVVGARAAYRAGEHTSFNQARAACCFYGFDIKSGHHTSMAGSRVAAYWCVYDVYIRGNCTLVNFYLDTEWQQIGKWYDDVATVKDTANLAKGNLFYTIIAAGVGVDNTKFIKTGGSILHTYAATSGFITSVGDILGSATDRAIPYFGSTGAISQDPTRLNYDYNTHTVYTPNEVLTGNIGINNGVAPVGNNRLMIDTATTADGLAEILLAINATTRKGLVIQMKASHSADPFQIQNSDGSLLTYISPSTNGTGTTTLIMNGDATNKSCGAFFYDQPGRTNFAYAGFGYAATGTFFGTGNGVIFASSKVGTGTQQPFKFGGFNSVWVDWLYISITGKVGIGTISPTAFLHIKAGTATANTAPLKFTSGTNLTTPEDGAVEYNGTDLQIDVSTTRYILVKTLQSSATLDFASTAAQNSTDLTVTVTGAALNDEVAVGVPNGAILSNSSFSCWVSATNTVTVRFNNYSSGSLDPASGTYRVSVIKH